MRGCYQMVPLCQRPEQMKGDKRKHVPISVAPGLSAISSEEVYANSCQERLFCTKTYPVVKRLRLCLWWMNDVRRGGRVLEGEGGKRFRLLPSFLCSSFLPTDNLTDRLPHSLPLLTHSIFCYVCSLGRTGLNHLAKQSGEEWWK